MKILTQALFVVLSATLAACAPLDRRALDARDYRNEDRQSRLVEYRQSCHRHSGRVTANPHGLPNRRSAPPRGYDTCSASIPKR